MGLRPLPMMTLSWRRSRPAWRMVKRLLQGLVNGLGFGSTEFHILRSTEVALPEYVYHFIRQEAFRRLAETEMTGSVGQRRVPAEFLRQAKFPAPPLAEQRRIVVKVEQVFAAPTPPANALPASPFCSSGFGKPSLPPPAPGYRIWRD